MNEFLYEPPILKVGIDFFPAGVKKIDGEIFLLFDLLLGFHFSECEDVQMTEAKMEEIREYFYNLLSQTNNEPTFQLKTNSGPLLTLHPIDDLIKKDIFCEKSWSQIFKAAQESGKCIWIKKLESAKDYALVDTETDTKYFESKKSTVSMNLYALSNDNQVSLPTLNQNNENIRYLAKKVKNEVESKGIETDRGFKGYMDGEIPRTHNVNFKVPTIGRDAKVLNIINDLEGLKTISRENIIDDIEGLKTISIDQKAYSFERIYQEILEHPALAKEQYGIWSHWKLRLNDLVDNNINLEEINSLDLVHSQLVVNGQDISGSSTTNFYIQLYRENHIAEELVTVTVDSNSIAHLPSYKIKQSIINGVKKYYHGHDQYGIIQYKIDPEQNFIFSLKSLVHKSAGEAKNNEDKVNRFSERLDQSEIKANDIDGLFIYHKIYDKDVFENNFYGVIGQNVICKRVNAKETKLFSLCQRKVRVKNKPILKDKYIKEEGWIWVDTIIEGYDKDQAVEYSDPILLTWMGDNLALPKPIAQRTNEFEDSKQNRPQGEEEIRNHIKLMKDSGFEHKYLPIGKSNIRFSSYNEYHFLLKYVCANGYTFPLRSTDLELGLDELVNEKVENEILSPFYDAWIKYSGFESSAQVHSIKPPTILGKGAYTKPKGPQSGKKSKKSTRKPADYLENDTHLIIGVKALKSTSLRYTMPSMLDLKEFEFLGYLDKDNLGTRNANEFVKRSMEYHNLGSKESIFKQKKNGQKIFKTDQLDYLADPRATKILITAHDWKTVNILRRHQKNNTFNNADYYQFRIDGKFNVYNNEKPGSIKLGKSLAGKPIININNTNVSIRLEPGHNAQFRMHSCDMPIVSSEILQLQQIKSFLSEYPYSHFKTSHAVKKPKEIKYVIPEPFKTKNNFKTLRSDEEAMQDFYYYELNFNADPSRLQILFHEQSNHIMEDGSWLDADVNIPSSVRRSMLDYEDHFLRDPDFISKESDDLYIRDNDHQFDELPPEALSLDSNEIENRDEELLSEDVYRREFGVDFLFDITIVAEHLEPGEFVWELSINSIASIILVYNADEDENGTKTPYYNLVLSRMKGDDDFSSTFPASNILDYENIANSVLVELVNSFDHKHKIRFEYYWGSDTSKKDTIENYAFNESDHKLKLRCSGASIDYIHSINLKEEPVDLLKLIGLPDPKLNEDRLSLNPKLNDRYCYEEYETPTDTEKIEVNFDFFPYNYTGDEEKDPYFIYSKDRYKRHHIKNIHFHGLSRYHGMYKDSKKKISCSSKCKGTLKLVLDNNYPVPTPVLSYTPLFFHRLEETAHTQKSVKEMILMLELDKSYQSGDQQVLGFVLKQKMYMTAPSVIGKVDPKKPKSISSDFELTPSCSQLGRDATWTICPTTGRFDDYIKGEMRTLFNKYFFPGASDLKSKSISKSSKETNHSEYMLLPSRPHFLKSKQKWIVPLKFRYDISLDSTKSLHNSYSFFVKIVTVNHQEHTTDFHPKISNTSTPIILPLFGQKEIKVEKTKETYKISVPVKNKKSRTPMNFYLACLSKHDSSKLISFSDADEHSFFMDSKIMRSNVKGKKYHFINPLEAIGDSTYLVKEIAHNKEAKYIYVFEIEAFDNSELTKIKSVDGQELSLLDGLDEGVYNLFNIEGIRIINIHQFEN